MLPVVDGPFEIAVDQIVELRGGRIAILLHNFPSRSQNDIFSQCLGIVLVSALCINVLSRADTHLLQS